MPAPHRSALQTQAEAPAFSWFEPILGLLVGALGGLSGSALLGAALTHGLLLGGLFGLTFGLFFARQAINPGAGLIWGLSCAFLLWVILPAGIMPLLTGAGHSAAMLRDARDHFPELVAYLLCLGLPVGIALGIRGARRYKAGQPEFRWARAVVAGGFSGTLAGLIFSRWMYVGEFFPLLAGFRQLNSQTLLIEAKRDLGRRPKLPAQPDPLVGNAPSSGPGLRRTVVVRRFLPHKTPSTDHSLRQHVELRPAETFLWKFPTKSDILSVSR